MRILITGGAGFVGSALVPQLVARGYDVDVADLFWFGNHLPKNVRTLHKDIFELTAADLTGYDQVIFLAGLSNDPMAEFAPSRNFILNAASPAYLAYIAKAAGVQRYIYASSCSVYGYTEDRLYDETSPTVSRYPYGMSKLQGEQGVLQLADSAFSVIALRKGTVCGYSPRMRFDLIVNTMFMTAMTEGVITVNNPSIWRPVLSVQDAANAYIRAVEANPKVSGVFNVASANYTVGEIADRVRYSLESALSRPVRIKVRNVQDGRNYKVSIDRAREALSFYPKDGVDAILKTLLDNIDTINDWRNPLYYNIQTMRSLPMFAPKPQARAAEAGASFSPAWNGRADAHTDELRLGEAKS